MDNSRVYEKLEGKCAEYLKKYYTSDTRGGYVRRNGFVLPERFQEFDDRIRRMEIRSDDFWVCSIPKSGTTWVQEAIWCIANDVDLETAKNRKLGDRFPFLEFNVLSVSGGKNIVGKASSEIFKHKLDSVGVVEKLPSPRFIKTHLPFTLLPEKLQHNDEAKILYIARNPRDTCISYYYHSRFVEGYRGTFEMFCELFLEGTVHYLPYWDHVQQFWQMRDKPNVLFLTYEEMKKDLKGEILKIAKFLGKTLDEKQIQDLTQHLSFECMKNNIAVNKEQELNLTRNVPSEALSEGTSTESGQGGQWTFMRSGRTDQWKEAMSQSMIQRFQEWEQEHLRDTEYPLFFNICD